VSRLAAFQHAFVQRISERDVAYAGSPIIEGAGERYFDPSMAGGDGVRRRYLLMLPRGAKASLIEAARQFVESHAEIVEFRQGRGSELLLVRPDGYMAYRSPHPNGIAPFEAMRGVISRSARQMQAH